MSRTSHQVSVAVSADLLEAIDREAFESDETRAATIRHILVEYLRKSGILSPKAAPTYQIGVNNRRHSKKA